MTRLDTRHRKHEVIGPLADAEPNAMAIHHALKPLDKLARDMEAKWGIDRLPELVPPEMAAKFGGALGQLQVAMRTDDLTSVQRFVANVMKGWQAMDAAATAAGHQPTAPECWPVRIGEQRAWIVRDPGMRALINGEPQGSVTYTLDEVGRLLALALGSGAATINGTKDLFPGATVREIRPTKPPCDFEGGGDQIPF